MNKKISKIKVLFIMHLPPPIHGAAMIGNFIKTSKSINNEIDAAYINLSTSTTLGQSGKGSFNKLVIFLLLVCRIIFKLFSNRFNICYVTLTASGPGFYKDAVIVAFLKLSGAKIIYHFHNKGVAQASKKWANRLLYKFVFSNTKSILLSPYLYPDIEQYVKKSDVYYCPNGIPAADTYLDKKYVMFSDKSKQCTFLYLSNMMHQKGAYILLNALKDLKERQLKFECHFVGAWSDIKEDDFKETVKESGLSEMVFVHGPKYGKDKNFFFNIADVFVFPTFYHYEAFPIVTLEAMQFSLAIISTPEGGIPDIIEDRKSGFLVPQKDSKELADKMELLIHNPNLRSAMGKEGRHRFEKFFTLYEFENKFISIIKDVSNK